MTEPNVYVQEFYWCYIDLSENEEESNDVQVAFVDSSHPYYCEYAKLDDGYCYDDCGPGICSDIHNPPKKMSFRIRRQYYDLIVKGEKTEEIRTNSEYWRKRLLNGHPPQIAVFVCGKAVHRRWITRIYVDEAENVLGRPLSAKGNEDILAPEAAIIIKLGDVWEPSIKSKSKRTNNP